ncbi:glycosyltransferase family 2 protein [Arcobacter cryaerophilus gv. pseudocryaerophilus]|uniref:Glycosyltransferase family 2 protein n=3 Tax=Arcobacteraceae TaxID=2808963 RepID=A0AA96DSL3_9BACT|nr:glycosyltransferase family 2 protein [Arcobacter sp. AZ-2023]WNL35384.1 glycosyltransferase family 2 protein [Arcobacter sp. AZ-2023]WPD11100.1 glycosyltransferase family 2 protein [Arcobacter sp. DSM 115960]
MSETPFFSIVIPTRNRADTLKYTIKTILNQDFQDYEIIICNNNSVDDTEEIVKKFSDKRIKYLKSNIDLSMSDNWELAYSKVTGQYVTYLADNDGFINGALNFMYKLLGLNNYPNIIRWEKNIYNWPSMESLNKDLLYINMLKKLEIIESKNIIQEVLSEKQTFQNLPMIYTSVIKRELVEMLIKKTGRLFHSASPDISSGFSFSLITDNYLSLSYGISCGSFSAKSNGYNSMRNKDNNISKDFKNLMNTSKINFHSNIPFVKSTIAAIVESFLKVKEALKYNKIDLDFKNIYLKIIKEVKIFDEEDLQETKTKIIEASKFNDKLHNFIIDYLEINPLKLNPYVDIKLEKGFKKNGALVLDGKDFNLTNIEEVSKFMGSFYNYSLNSISFPIVSESNLNLIEKSSKIAIWGNGSFSKKLQELIFKNREDIEICFIIDSYKKDKSNKIPILLPENLDFSNINYLIIASSFLNEFKDALLLLDIKEVKILKFE